MEDPKNNPKHQKRVANLKELCRIWGQPEAEIIKSFLESQGIPCFFHGQIVPSIYPFSVDGLGEIKIFVPQEDYETAKMLIENRETEAEK